MPVFMDESNSMPTPPGTERGPIPRWLLIAHRIVGIVVTLMAIYVVLMVLATAVLGGHSLATGLLSLWHRIHAIWT